MLSPVRLSHSIGIMAFLALGGCSGTTAIGLAPEIESVSADALVGPDVIDHDGQFQTYYVGPYDRLVIDVLGFEELSGREIQVDSGGNFSFPLVGLVDARGMTLGDLQIELTNRFKQAHVRQPEVSVNLKESNSKFISVSGEVKEPGLYPVLGNMTLAKAIASAKGTAEYAKLGDVVVLRTVDGQRYAALYNLDAIQRGNYVDPQIYPGDVIVVGNSKSRRLFEELLRTIPSLATPLIVALQR